MTIEKSCGAVVFTRIEKEIRYVIIQSTEGIYGFPKGHMEAGETEEATALREIREEVGLTPKLLEGFRVEESYPLPRKKDTIKQVIFFLAEYTGQEIHHQREELNGAQLMGYEEALQLFQFENTRNVLRRAHAWLTENA